MIEISVVMVCRNEAATLEAALGSLAAQECTRAWDIVFVDNGSTDATRRIVEEFATRHPHIPLELLSVADRANKAHGLNIGIRHARGAKLLFLDGDDTVAPGWLAAMADALNRNPFVAARYGLTALNPAWTLEIRRNAQERGLLKLDHAPFCFYAGGATLGMHRTVFDAAGDFDPDLEGLEDTDFCIRAHRAGFRLVFVPDAIYNYRFRTDLEALHRQARIYARQHAWLRARYAKRQKPKAVLTAWLGLGVELARFAMHEARRKAAGRSLTTVEAAKRARTDGTLRGDLSGALAFGVAPPHNLWRVRRKARDLVHGVLGRFFGVTVAVRTPDRLMALTFDDGPDPATTPVLLDLLARHGMKATFFLIGSRAAHHPELVARIVAEGHEIGHHSWDHPSLPGLSPPALEAQLARTVATLAPHAGTLLRPPYGDYDLRTHRRIRRAGYRPIFWSVSSGDWRGRDADFIVARILKDASPGAIVLLHDTLFSWESEEARDRTPTFEAVDRLATELPDYRFVTVSELLARGPAFARFWKKAPDRALVTGFGAAEPVPVRLGG